MQKSVIIVAGGAGKRFNSEIPKQFLLLNGLPVLMHTISVFYKYEENIDIIVVLPEKQNTYWIDLCKEFNFQISHTLVNGGETRFHSTKNALPLIEPGRVVAIHDGVRPLVSPDTINRCFLAAKKFGNAIPVIPVYESIRKVENENNFPVNRDDYVLIQTPEVVQIDILLKAFEQEYIPEFTATSNVIEKMGIKLNLVEGNKENIKITSQLDLLIAECLIKKEKLKKQ